MAAGMGLSGCGAGGQRNLDDAIIVTTAPSLAEGETRLVLELRDAREEFPLTESDGFLSSERAARLNPALRSQLRERCQILRRTLPQARREMADGLAIIRPDAQRAHGDGNIAVYVAGKPDIHVFFSCAEIGQLLAWQECGDDLATIRYTHPGFDPARLGVLRDRVAALGLKVENVPPSPPGLERLRTEAATRLLERYLRENGVQMPDGSPLLVTGPLPSARSPKLTGALGNPSVMEQVLRSRNPDVLRALFFLVNRHIVDLPYP
jgi:hypothetical protein